MMLCWLVLFSVVLLESARVVCAQRVFSNIDPACHRQLAQWCGKISKTFFNGLWINGFPGRAEEGCDHVFSDPTAFVSPPLNRTCHNAFPGTDGPFQSIVIGFAELSYCASTAQGGECNPAFRPVYLCYPGTEDTQPPCCTVEAGVALAAKMIKNNMCTSKLPRTPTSAAVATGTGTGTATATATATVTSATVADSRQPPSSFVGGATPTSSVAAGAGADGNMEASPLSPGTIAAIAGGAGGGVLLLLCVVAAILISHRRRARKQSKSEPEHANANDIQMRYSQGPPEHTYSDPNSVRNAPDYIVPRPPQSSYASGAGSTILH
jgi:hypothetical protein